MYTPTHSRRTSAVVTAVTTLLVVVAAPATALDPPANDDFDDATVIEALEFTDAVDTTEATRATDDPDCFGTGGSTVWYALTLPEDTFVEINTFGSDYDTILEAYTGGRGDLTEVRCNDDAGEGLQSRIRFDATGGTTYHVMVSSYDFDGGGNLQIRAFETTPPPPLEVAMTLDDEGRVDRRSGTAWLTGTVTCLGGDFVEVYGSLRQRWRRVYIFGSGFEEHACDGTTIPFTLEITGETGLFDRGTADAYVEAFTCGEEDCVADTVEQEVTLRRRRR